MIAFIGDVHALFGRLHDLWDHHPALWEADAVIQLGDFGLFPSREYVPPPRPIYWLDGNHEYFPDLKGITEPTEVRENAIYVPRGTVLELGGFRVGFLGGADSIDRHMRVDGVSWFPEETISYSDMMKFPENAEIDVLATHTPPAHVVRLMISAHGVEPSARAVEAVWDGLGRPACFSGHMHEFKQVGRCFVLPELGVHSLV